MTLYGRGLGRSAQRPAAPINRPFAAPARQPNDKRPEHIHVIIDEVEPENWGYAGMLTTEYRESQERPALGGEPNTSR